MSKPDPFVWREIEFKWNHMHSWYEGDVLVGGQRLWFIVSDTIRQFQAWVQWEGGYTVSCTMSERDHALEGARLELISTAYHYHRQLLERFP